MEDKKVLPPPRKNSGKSQKAQEQGAGGGGGSNGENEGGEAAPTSKSRKLAGIRPRISIEELRNVFKRQASVAQEEGDPIFDPMAKAQGSMKIVRGKTGVVYDERMAQHRCLWDQNYPECPERLLHTLERCKDLGLLNRCETLVSRAATEEELLKVHSIAHLGLLWSTMGETDTEKLEQLSSHFDSIYLHPSTYENSLLAAGSTLDLVDAVASGRLQNGFALVRPPGHHAMESELCGYCYLNNVALAVRHALEKHSLSRILIVDWDVHHGQASQYAFYSDPRVLYFSIHRYQQGSFWPHLRESNYNYVGEGTGQGFNFNVPLNKIGMRNEDYLAIFHQVLLPVAYEFNPELIIVSAGYDAAVGCPEGEMDVSSGFYSHLTSSLMTLAQGRVAVVFEGGYCLDSLAEGAAMTLSTLLGDSCPILLDPIKEPSSSLRETLLNLIYVQRPYWKCFQYQGSFSVREESNEAVKARHTPSLTFLGLNARPLRFPTREVHIVQSPELLERIKSKLLQLKLKERTRALPGGKLCLVYDEEMSRHRSLSGAEHPERPERTEQIWEYLKQYGIIERATVLKSRRATREEVELVHTKDHVDFMFNIGSLSQKELESLQDKYKSIYFHSMSNDAALLASGSLLQVVDSVCNNKISSGIGVVRPPGHHAERDHPHGFCFYNNVAVAARYALKQYGYQRVMILDWDVHHGNGIQHTFESDPHVLYISIHRYDQGLFFPSSEDANYDRVGTGAGEGYNVNIPWNKSGLGDAEYISAMLQVVLPIAYQYDPQLVLVSAGFDAARGDPLGGCRVTPECYGHMTRLLSSLAGGRIVLALEGGYNLNTISYCMTMCAKALLGDPLPMLDASLVPNKGAVQTINDVIRTQSQYWSALCFQVDLPVEDVLCQGFGGGPQAVESGASGSEASSCTSSPVSTPSTNSPPYISAPSSPGKSNAFRLTGPGRAAPMACGESETRICTSEMQVDSCTQFSVTAQPQDEANPSGKKKKIGTKNKTGSSPAGKALEAPPQIKEQCKKVRRRSERQEVPPNPERSNFPLTPTRPGRPRSDGALRAAAASVDMLKGPTAVISNEDYCNVCCVEYMQGPGIIKAIIERCKELKLLEKCTRLKPRPATEAEILAVHGEERLKAIPRGTRKCIYHPVDGDDILTAAGSTVELVQEIVSGKAQNGIAIIIPSGHLVSGSSTPPSGYLNNTAIAARYALDNLGLSRVLIVDWDGQHGIGTQHIFYSDPRVLVFSVLLHSSQDPEEGDKNKTGILEGHGYNFNVKLNCHVFQNEDYYSVFHQVLLPVAYEFSPELVIVSAGFELALHSENIHPGIYSHLTAMLMPIAQGRLAVVLEAGKCKEAMAEGVAATLRTLLDKPSEPMPMPLNDPSPEVKKAITEVMTAQKTNWDSIRYHAQTSLISYKPKVDSSPVIKPLKHPYSHHLQKLGESIPSPKYTVCLVYDDSMMEHFNYKDETHPERPERISCIYQRLQEFGVVGRCHRIKARKATVSDLESVHSSKHIKFMSSLMTKKPQELLSAENKLESIYLHRRTNNAALMAAGSLVAVVDSVMSGESQRGMAVVRPPGHHAERDNACGFCFYNNVAIAAKHAINTHGLQRVLILDWDVHHGNGIQQMFESDPQVLYISVHRYDNGKFFPASSEGNYNRVGTKEGKGYNVNIPWNKRGMGDGDYVATMVEVVLPIAYEFKPQLVLVAAGFDASVGDPLGGCSVTPECYGHMTKLLMCVAEGRVILALEGGYNLASISYCMTMCAKALLGDPLVPLAQNLTPCISAIETLTNVVSVHKKFWSALNLKNEALSPLGHISSSRRDTGGASPKLKCKTDNSVSQSPNKKFDDLDELTETLDRVKLVDTDKGVGASSDKVQGEESHNEEMEEDVVAEGGACGGSAGDNVNTFLLSELAAAEEMFAVIPATWCPHLEEVKPVPRNGLKTSSPCEECQDPTENWICLTCYKVLCGRFVNEHMMMHGLMEEHKMVLSFSDLSVWCYACDVYVHHQILHEAKRAAHLDKFGEDIPEFS
ncbi:histone deacetylase 6-like [Homarus americanus]|uniref:Protein deacetylase HDAC6 n=1 Tax=Homarus americanus TaxID=6706 RepID=A0A8J5N186_HOMAM|nr:histone deacetylase 6-like [Homarus americanus]XP_042217780.1 histone deacetylase 6-like [Homarus americanus]KAG7171304.1 histone deacetylase 6-like [Homarus americanus]